MVERMGSVIEAWCRSFRAPRRSPQDLELHDRLRPLPQSNPRTRPAFKGRSQTQSDRTLMS